VADDGPNLQAAADDLLDQLLAHTGRRLDDDVALLLVELTPLAVRPEQDFHLALAPGLHAVGVSTRKLPAA
jgi:hypothetical protein